VPCVHLPIQVRKLDWCVWMCSFLSTMFLGVEIGLAISIGLALMIVIYESAFPHTALLGRVGRTTIYRNVKQFPDSQVGAETMMMHLWWGLLPAFRSFVLARLWRPGSAGAGLCEGTQPLHHLACSSVRGDVDSVGDPYTGVCVECGTPPSCRWLRSEHQLRQLEVQTYTALSCCARLRCR
jgi:hypothetical protein